MAKVVKQELTEAKPKEFMTNTEKKLKKKLIDLLRDDGKGHRHAKYAERLERFDIQIVPLKVDPEFTAAISFDTGIIYISEGFLNDPATFYQLNVLLRHELAHNLLMHQIRMTYKLGETAYSHIGLSAVLHDLQNIIADDEISNRKYSEEDKIIVRNMVLNGRVISGLVTEDHRKDWVNLSIEEMYDKICEEIDEIHSQILSGRKLSDLAREKSGDVVGSSIINAYIYSDTDSDSCIPGSLESFIKRGCSIGGKRWRVDFCEIAENIFNELKDADVTDELIKKLINKIALSSPVKMVDLFDNKKVELYTPEEKYVAVEVLKKFKSEYLEWYGKVMSSLDDLTDEELYELIDMLK